MERLIEERRSQFVLDKKMEILEREEEERREAERRAIVEQERQRLLKEHAAKLLGYLPKVSQVIQADCKGIDFSLSLSLSLGSVQRLLRSRKTWR